MLGSHALAVVVEYFTEEAFWTFTNFGAGIKCI